MNKFWFLAIFLITAGHIFSQTTLSLQQAIDLATNNNLVLKQGAAGVEFTERASNQSRLLLLPNLNLGTSYFSNFGYTIDPVTNLPLSNNFQTQGYQLNSSLNLFSGGSVGNTIKKSKTDLQVAGMTYKESVEDVQFQVIAAYLAVMFAEEQVKIADDKIKTTELQLSNSKSLVNAGNIPEGNLLAIEAQLSQDELANIQAKNQLDKAYLDLKLLLQMKPDENIKIIFPDINKVEQILSTPVPNANDVADYAVANKASIKKYDYQLMSDELAKKIAGAAALPSLSLIGQVSTNYSNAIYPPYITEADPYNVQLDNNLSEVVGVTLQIPLFNNGTVLLNKQNAELTLINTQLNQQIAINTLRQSVTQAVNDLRAAIASYNAAEKNYDAAQKAYEYAQKRFNLGTTSSFDFTTATFTFAQAESSLLQAKYDLIFKSKIIDYYLDKPLDL
ncbi:MAG: TolC family protein [Chitinophagales bacterium]